MKKTLLARRNALFSSTKISWGALALVAVIFLLLFRLLAPNLFLKMFTPLFRVADATTEVRQAFFSSFRDTAALALQNEKLTRENAALMSENQTLREKVGSISSLGDDVREGIVAGVVARPPESPYDTLVLSEGSENGITLGMRAFGEGGVPLGVVSEVLTDFSRVTLFSAHGMVVDGWVGQAHVPITITGEGAGAMSASVSRLAGVAVGDTVFAPGPGMLVVGAVTRIDNSPSSSSLTLHIMSAVNLFSISWVAVRDLGALLP